MAAKKPQSTLKAAVMSAGAGPDTEFDEYEAPEAMEDPQAVADDEAIFQNVLKQFFPGLPEEEYLQFHRVAHTKLNE